MDKELHELKIWPQYFDDVESGKKPFEVRKLDRLFGVGHTLWLREWSPIKGYSGRETKKEITYVMAGGQWGLSEGNCILGIKPLSREQPLREAMEKVKQNLSGWEDTANVLTDEELEKKISDAFDAGYLRGVMEAMEKYNITTMQMVIHPNKTEYLKQLKP